ncbi:MAG: Ig-like domain-containing protein [Taibaiella sp.]|nr:Ig-like domain-containing protein [Taibaiella sp.]
MKKHFILLPLIAALLYIGLSSSSGGLSADYSGAYGGSSCGTSGCHGGSSSSTTMSIVLDSAGTPVTTYYPGRTYNITFTGTNTSSAGLPKFGFQLEVVRASGAGSSSAVDGGALASSGLPTGCAYLTLSSTHHLIQHNTRLNPTTGSGGTSTTYSRTLVWTAPSAGTGSVKIYAALNAINNDAGTSGDKWNQMNVTITESSATTVAAITGPSSVCVGATITLANATSGGTWSSASTSIASIDNSGQVTGLSPGTSVISYAAGASGTATTTITVIAAPSSGGTISGATRVCVGASTTLSTTATSGTWTSSNTSVASVNSATGAIFGVSAGVATISYSVTNACGVGRSTYPDTVAGAPAAGTISGPTRICLGSSITLTASGGVSGGTWSSSNTSVSTVNPSTGVVTSVSAGTATISYRVTGTCGTGTATYPDTVGTSTSPGTISGPGNVCPGNTVTMTRTSGSGGGTWSSSNTSIATINSTTGLVTGITPGTVTISYTVTSSVCGSATATTTLTVATPPPAIGGPASTCVNSPVTLTNAVSSGIWTSSNSSIAVAAAGFGTVTGVTAGAVTITYTAPGGCFTTTAFTVNSIPAPITGTFNTCPGAQVTLSDVSAGGVWSSADTNIAKVTAAGLVRGIAANTTTISYTYPSTGCYVTASMLVNPNPSFIVGAAFFCESKTDSLQNYTAGGTWTSANPSIGTVNPTTGLLTGLTGGNVTVTYTLPTGCYMARTFRVHPLPVPVITYDLFAGTLKTDAFYTSYQWYANGVMLPGAVNRSVAVPDNATYTVYVTDTFGCGNMSTVFTVTNVGVNDVATSMANISIHPNPANGIVNIESPVNINIVVTGVEGKVILEQTNAKTIDITNLAKGVYMILIYDTNGRKVGVQKLMKQ